MIQPTNFTNFFTALMYYTQMFKSRFTETIHYYDFITVQAANRVGAYFFGQVIFKTLAIWKQTETFNAAHTVLFYAASITGYAQTRGAAIRTP